MRSPSIDAGGLAKPGLSQYALRFVFGGVVTTLTGLVAREWGPSAGGLFLAFPAILPASLTLVARHDTRRDATDDARGAVLGATALIVFAAVVLALVRTPAWAALGAATAAWLASAVALWMVRAMLARPR
ncbi:MAG TPA: DUF3147 family protein [Candidatus Binatia bacterium]|jgi:hypothetical protein